MDSAFKQRIIGAGVLLALIVIVVPMLFSKHPEKSNKGKVSLVIPVPPQPRMQTKTLYLAAPASASHGAPVSVQNNSGPATAEIHNAAAANSAPSLASSKPGVAPFRSAAKFASQTKVKKLRGPSSRRAHRVPTARVTTKLQARRAKPLVRPVKPTVKPLAAGTAAQKSYIISLGAYANHANTERLLAGVHKLGITVHVEPLSIGGKAVQKVFAGPFATRAGAEDARLRIRRRYPRIPAVLLVIARNVKTSQPGTALPAKQPGAWVVQVAAFRHHPVAEKLVRRLRKAGFAAYSDSVKTSRGTFWRVRVGPETRRAAALAVRDHIATSQHLRGVVVSNR